MESGVYLPSFYPTKLGSRYIGHTGQIILCKPPFFPKHGYITPKLDDVLFILVFHKGKERRLLPHYKAHICAIFVYLLRKPNFFKMIKKAALAVLLYTITFSGMSQCDLKKSSEKKEGYTMESVEHNFELIERLAGRTNNGDLSEGFLNTHAAAGLLYESTTTDTLLNMYLMLTTVGTVYYNNPALPREITVNFTCGSEITLRAFHVDNESLSSVSVPIFYFKIDTKEHFPYFYSCGINSILVNDYKASKKRLINLTYKDILKDQFKCFSGN